MSQDPMVTVDGVRYRLEDAIRLKLVPDPSEVVEKAAEPKVAVKPPNKMRSAQNK